MSSAQRVLVSFGLSRLFHEIVAAAMSEHGWHVMEFGRQHAGQQHPVDIMLVFASGTPESILHQIGVARSHFPTSKVVLLGPELDDSEVIRCIEAGVSAHVVGEQSFSELATTIRMLHDNKTLSSGRVTQLVLGDIGRLTRQRDTTPGADLTKREAEILKLMGAGLSNKEIADQLSIAANTVKNHVHHILEKLNVNNRHQATSVMPRIRQGFPIAG